MCDDNFAFYGSMSFLSTQLITFLQEDAIGISCFLEQLVKLASPTHCDFVSQELIF